MRLLGKFSAYQLDPDSNSTVLKNNGRFSITFKGIRERDQKTVVIKKFHPRRAGEKNAKEKFLREAELFGNSASVTQVLDVIDDGKGLYIIREYIEGVPLEKFIKSSQFKKIIRQNELFTFFSKILDRVEALHDEGIIHCDLKTSNFIVDHSGSVFLIDLGNSFFKEELKGLKQDKDDPLSFSFHYSSPELMLNFPDLVDERSDVFSLGCIFYECLTGVAPWKSSHPASLTHLQLVYPLEKNKRLGDQLFNYLEKATRKYLFPQPPNRLDTVLQRLYLQEAIEERFDSVAEMKNELKKMKEQQEVRLSFLFRWF